MQPYPTQNLITVSGFKSRNSELDLSGWSDATISGFISTATRGMQSYANVQGFLSTVVSGEVQKAVITAMGDLVVYPLIRPIQTDQPLSIALQKGGFSTNLTISGSSGPYYQVPYPYTSLIYPSSYLAGIGTLMIGGSSQLVTLKGAGTFTTMSYTGGFKQTPDDLQDACDLWVRDIVTRKLNPFGAQEIRQGSVSISRTVRSSNPNADMVDSVYIQQAKRLLDEGGYVRTVLG